MAICSLGEDGYMAEAVENGGYPNGYNTVAGKYGFSKSIAVDDINQPATREQTAQIISNTINMPIKRFGAINSITADHKTESEKFLVTYDGSKEYYPLTTLKTMLQTNDWAIRRLLQLNPLLKIQKNFTHTQQSKIYHSRKYLLNPRDF